MTKVFIDGQSGTTGLQIFDMLRRRSELEIITIPETQRKIPEARKELLNSSDITIFCLPDDAAIEALIDALNEIEDIEDAREELFDHYANEVV